MSFFAGNVRTAVETIQITAIKNSLLGDFFLQEQNVLSCW